MSRDERARFLGGTVVAVLLAAGGTHFYESRTADARVLAAEARDAAHLAEVQETSARASIEVQAELAACRLDLEHDRRTAEPSRGELTDLAEVVSATGATTVRAHTTCDVELDWDASDDEQPCRALVRCGTMHVYGDVGSGFFACTLDAHGPVHGEDAHPTSDGGDPRIVVDRASRTIVVSDDGPAWEITLRYDPDDLVLGAMEGLDGL